MKKLKSQIDESDDHRFPVFVSNKSFLRQEKKTFHCSGFLQVFGWHPTMREDKSDRTFGCRWIHQLQQVFCYLAANVTSPAQSFSACHAASTCGAGGESDEARRRMGWRTKKVSRVTWRPGRLWRRHPLPPPVRLRGAPGSHWTVRQLGSATLWAGSSGGMARRSWSRPGDWPSEGSPCHTGSEKKDKKGTF